MCSYGFKDVLINIKYKKISANIQSSSVATNTSFTTHSHAYSRTSRY